MAGVAPSVPQIIRTFGRARNEAYSLAPSCAGDVPANEGYRLNAMFVAHAGFTIVHAAKMGEPANVRNGSNSVATSLGGKLTLAA
jgi:hypothetical protein